ncbi:MAG: ribosomal-processing cysteine protease Prp [Desulfitobacteriaceae bacterium]
MTLWLDTKNRVHQFELSGHAGFAEEGKDPVCAAVSALSIAAVNGLERFLAIPPVVENTDGFLTCALRDIAEEDLDHAQWILQTMSLGIEDIQRNYGKKYLKINRRRWTPC